MGADDPRPGGRPDHCELVRSRLDLFEVVEPGEQVPERPRVEVGPLAAARGEALARALATRLAAVVPEGFAVEAVDGDVLATTRGDFLRQPIAAWLEQEGYEDATVATIAHAVVGGVQSLVSDHWPGGWPRCGVPGLPPPPDVEVVGGRIRARWERRLELPEIAPEEWR